MDTSELIARADFVISMEARDRANIQNRNLGRHAVANNSSLFFILFMQCLAITEIFKFIK